MVNTLNLYLNYVEFSSASIPHSKREDVASSLITLHLVDSILDR